MKAKNSYRNVWHRAFQTELDPQPLINGIATAEEARTAWNEANRNDVPEPLKEKIQAELVKYR